MNYQETIQFLFSQLPMYQRIGKAAYKANLDNTLALDSYFNHPHRQFKSIHVAGTNGKGSVSHMLASVLMEAGYRVGLYTSPHLKDFRERIKVNGQMITEEYVVDFIANHGAIFNEVKPSFFEMTVAMAFQYFATEKVDVAVIEVGLGGRLDSTNIITPELAVITNIGLDHTDLLGNSLKSIALEKAGIIKPGAPVLIGEAHGETKGVFIEKAREQGAPLSFADELYKVDPMGIVNRGLRLFAIEAQQRDWQCHVKLGLLGEYQAKNLATFFAAADILRGNGFAITELNTKSGLEKVVVNTSLLGRWQVLDENPLTICDTGHNAHGVEQVVKQLLNTPHNQLHIVFGVVGDKDVRQILALMPGKAQYYFSRASIPRALEAEQLKLLASEYGLHGNAYDSVREALDAARGNARQNDLIFIGGSTFVVADIVP